MEPITPVTPTPPANGGDQPPKKTVEELETELAAAGQKITELDSQRTHWKDKYERDIVNAVHPQPPGTPLEDGLSDEGRALKGEINTLNKRIETLTAEREREAVFTSHPQLKDKKEEFDEFLADPKNSGIKLERAATLFLAEQGLLGTQTTPKRQGLEKPTSGPKTPQQQGYTAEDIGRIRVNEPRRYAKMIQDGTIKGEDIK